MIKLLISCLLLLVVCLGVAGMVQSSSRPVRMPTKSLSSQNLKRREALVLAFGMAPVAFFPPSKVGAFENRISTKYDDKPKTRGSKPKDLGVSDRTSTSLDGENTQYVGLKGCGAAPNCFSSSLPPLDDPDHAIPPFIWPDGLTQEQAFQNLKDAIMAYPPGQNGVDGGGFGIQTFDPKQGYLYVQFESLKRGYIDDLEFAVVPNDGERVVQVRSSSRIGYLDFGVNAKRLNYIAKSLKSKGWTAAGVDFDTHPGYKLENEL